jgi:SAM-dependent methyltransferase
VNFADAQKLIDYFVDKFVHTQGNFSLYVAVAAALLSFVVSALSLMVSINASNRQYEHSVYMYLAQVWYGLLDTAVTEPLFMDASKTINYYDTMTRDELLKYGAYCYKAWSLVEDIVAKKYHEDRQFRQLINWVSAHHRPWLDRNPTFFATLEFWSVVDRYKNQPNLVYECPKLPRKDGEIDWDLVAPDYLNYVLSPFSPEMVRVTSGKRRNLLLNYLNAVPDDQLKSMDIADFGCGPGNLIRFLKGRVRALTGVDTSSKALDLAERQANDASIEFKRIQRDIRELPRESTFDLIISTNSILPKQRSDIVPMWAAMRSALKPGGKIIAILPSFDTIEYLISLWQNHYSAELKGSAEQERVKGIIKAFEETKNINHEQLSYAEDGHNVQCYHTPSTILSDLKEAGLRLVGKMEKVYYPWNLAKRFDYGNFPNASEEIWDWFVVVERDELAGGGEAKVGA